MYPLARIFNHNSSGGTSGRQQEGIQPAATPAADRESAPGRFRCLNPVLSASIRPHFGSNLRPTTRAESG
jgi:hypothetical protein